MKLTESQEKWLTALESGQYMQGNSVLHNTAGNSFCCLGVACDLFIPETKKKLAREYAYGKEQNVALAPQEIVDELNLWDEQGPFVKHDVFNGEQVHSLVCMNDKGISFKEIAAYIRKNPENVFREGAE